MEQPEALPSSTAEDNILSPLVRTLFPATVVYVFLIMLVLLSAVTFIYQFQYEEIMTGIRYTDTPVGAVHVWAHALRAAVGLLLALGVHQYHAAIRAVRRSEADAGPRVVASISTGWKKLAISAIVVVAFGLWNVYATELAETQFTEFETFGPANAPEVVMEFRLADFQPSENFSESTHSPFGQPIWLYPEPVISNKHIANATVTVQGEGVPAINVTFTADGEAAIRTATKQHLDRPMAIIVDGQIISSPIVRWELGESAMITGLSSRQEAERIARSLSGRR